MQYYRGTLITSVWEAFALQSVPSFRLASARLKPRDFLAFQLQIKRSPVSPSSHLPYIVERAISERRQETDEGIEEIGATEKIEEEERERGR